MWPRPSLWLLTTALLAACNESSVVRTTSTVAVDAEASFGRVWVGDASKTTLVVAATGTGFVEIRSLVAGPGITLLDDTPDGRRIGPGVRRKLQLGWTPTGPGLLDTTVIVTTDVAGDTEHVVRITGEARAIPSCDDGNQCTDDAFDRARERCDHATHERPCDDGSACTMDDRCDEGACRGIARICDDDNVCTLDACDPALGCVHPPDGRQCDDGDPCTTDLCDRDDGCDHTDAPDGTSCGTFSCSTIHTCVFGTCRELDVTGSSDGFPCSDGDRCTDNDTCRAGACTGGPRRQGGPEIVTRLDTWGGEGASVATDGYRYLFSDRADMSSDDQSLRVAVLENGALRPAGSMPLTSDVPPVLLAPGHFALASGGHLAFVDATDPEHLSASFEPLLPSAPSPIRRLVRTAGGLVLERVADGSTSGVELVYVPVDGTLQPGATTVLSRDMSITDLDTDGHRVVFVSSSGARVLEIDPTTGVSSGLRELPMLRDASRVSIQGSMVAAIVRTELVVVDLDTPTNEAVPCSETGEGCRELARRPLTEPVNDIALIGSELFWATESGIRALPLLAFEESGPPVPIEPRLIDFVAASWLDRGAGHLLASGPIALPLRLEPGADGAFGASVAVRITGPGHGEVTAVVDTNSGRVRVVGPHAVGEIDLEAKEIARWTLTATAPSATRPRVSMGVRRGALISRSPLEASGESSLSVCQGVVLEDVDGTGQITRWPACTFTDGHFAVVPGRLLAVPRNQPMLDLGAMPPALQLRAWGLVQPFVPDAFIDVPIAPLEDVFALRTSDDGRFVGLLGLAPTGTTDVRITLHDARTSAQLGEFPMEPTRLAHGFTRTSFLVDATAALSFVSGTVRLHPRTTLPSTTPNAPRPFLLMPFAGTAAHQQVVAMSAGRAWVGWDVVVDDSELQPTPFFGDQRFAEVHYDASAGTLEDRGHLELPSLLHDAWDTGDLAVAATRSSVVVVAPSCR